VRPNLSRLLRHLLGAALLCPVLVAAQTTGGARPAEEVPFVTTPPLVVERMLQLAELKPDDRLADLGSGDGRIVMAAARRGAFARGFEIDGALVALSQQRAERAGLVNRTEFLQKDIFDANYAEYSVVTMYLLPEYNLKLRPTLLEQLKPGARIVSHDWDMGEWEPDETLTVRMPTKLLGNDKAHRVHLWIVPEKLGGRWRVRGDGIGAAFDVTISQQFQKLEATASRGTIRAIGLRGRALTFVWNDGIRTFRFAGSLEAGRLRGLVGSLSDDVGKASWDAQRN
jgi:hypothetical protein